MSEKRRRLSTEIQLLEQRSEELSASAARRIESIDGDLRNWLSPIGTVALGAGAGFLAERLTGGRSLGRFSGVLVSLLSSLGSVGAAMTSEVEGGEQGPEDKTPPPRTAASAEQMPADAPF